MERIIMHIDVNNAFLSWTAIELLNNGCKYDIRNSYAVIGGDPKARKGIVLAKSNSAKKQGIVTAETLYSAKKKCPVLRVYPPNYKFYQEMSHKLFELLYKYTPDIEVASVDECYLDYTNVKHLYGESLAFARKIQKEIYDTLGFTVNVGIANNKLCAKMASDFEKPYKIHTLFKEEIQNKMWPLKVGELFGIGKKSVPKLESLKIFTIGDLANAKLETLNKYFKNQSQYLIDIANGIDTSPVISIPPEPKGIGSEITLPKDITNKDEIFKSLAVLSEQVSLRIKKQNKYALTVTIVLKDNLFKRSTHQKKIVNAIRNSEDILKIAKDLYEEMKYDKPVRLIGIRLNNLVDTVTHQVSIFDDVKKIEENNELEETIDKLKEKYGLKIIK
ncbi:MAG: DNA polymerase IV [Bacilli bacterium]|nr:DNA polymerase IV [Bacilli bacterium]